MFTLSPSNNPIAKYYEEKSKPTLKFVAKASNTLFSLGRADLEELREKEKEEDEFAREYITCEGVKGLEMEEKALYGMRRGVWRFLLEIDQETVLSQRYGQKEMYLKEIQEAAKKEEEEHGKLMQ